YGRHQEEQRQVDGELHELGAAVVTAGAAETGGQEHRGHLSGKTMERLLISHGLSSPGRTIGIAIVTSTYSRPSTVIRSRWKVPSSSQGERTRRAASSRIRSGSSGVRAACRAPSLAACEAYLPVSPTSTTCQVSRSARPRSGTSAANSTIEAPVSSRPRGRRLRARTVSASAPTGEAAGGGSGASAESSRPSSPEILPNALSRFSSVSLEGLPVLDASSRAR